MEGPGDFPLPLRQRSGGGAPQPAHGAAPPSPVSVRPPPTPRPAWSRVSPRGRAAALTQSAQQDRLAPFLRLRPLFVAGPEQGLQASPSLRALHLPHGRRARGAQRPTASGEHWRFLEGAAVTQAGYISCPGPQNKQVALVHGRVASENAFFVLLAKTKQG